MDFCWTLVSASWDKDELIVGQKVEGQDDIIVVEASNTRRYRC